MSELEVFRFEGAELRTASLNGEPAVVLSDLAKLLGYRSASDASRILRDHHRGYAEVRTPGGPQTMLVVTEQGMNRLLMRSNASNAEQVQDWLSDEVMPSIRRTGTYSAPETPEQLMARAVVQAQQIIARKDEQIAVLAPRAEAWDELASASGDYEVADAAKILARAGVETGQQRLFAQLAELGWIYRGPQGKWKAYQSAVDSGYLAEKPQSHHHPRTGEIVLDPPQVRVTVRGLERLRMRLGKLTLVAG